jgi:hypothetical protein
LFIRPPEVTSQDNKITGYEYYFNDDFANRQYVAISPQDDFNLIADVDVSNLPGMLNTLHIRFVDNTGKWSGIVNKMFIRPPESDMIAGNAMIQYEYWFDSDRSNLRTIDVNPSVTDLNVVDLDMNHVWRGQHILHTRYKDATEKWSGITTDTVMKLSRPLARFTMDATQTCVGQIIQFTDNNSVDYDTYVWDFGDGTTSTNINETHSYSSPGTYTVRLTVTDTNTNISNTMQQNIVIDDYPTDTVSITGNNPACFGETVTLTADASGMIYLWNTGETTQSINVTDAGNYYVQITNPSGAQCSVQSDTISINFYPEIDNTVTINNNPVELVANQSGATYQWLDCDNANTAIAGETNQNFIPTQSGSYAVEITLNACTVTSNCETVTIVSVDKIDWLKNIKIYPNPVKNTLLLDSESTLQVSIITLDGKVIDNYNLLDKKKSIDVSNICRGIYIARISFTSGKWKGRSINIRFIKE